MTRYSLSLLFFLAPTLVLANEPTANLLPTERPIEQAVDHYINAALQQESVKAAPATDDAGFIRRLTLDLLGRIPTPSETADYVASKEPSRKVQLVERLLASPAFARHQSTEFHTILQYETPNRKGGRSGVLREYLQTSFADNKGWDAIFRELLLPNDNDPKQRGASEFLKSRVKDQNRLTIDASSLFFGVNVSCAQCHDHPHVHSWTQDHFYGMKSFFARTIDNGGFLAERDFGIVKYLPNKGQEKVAPVMFLTGKKLDVPGMKDATGPEKKKEQERLDSAKKAKKAAEPPAFSLRAKLVETALEPSSRHYFARNIVNRVWHRLLGRGLVMPLDQLHSENPASHPALLDWLARDLAEHGYDLKRLTRGIVLSDAYARGSRQVGDPPAERLFAVGQLRALTPMQLAVALKVASVDPESLPRDVSALEKRMDGIEKSADSLARLFPFPGENFQVSVTEAMLFANNQGLQRDLLEGTGTLVERLKGIADPNQRAELAVRSVLSRPARPEEVMALGGYLRQRADRPEAANQQMVWALLTSAEFRFNH